MLSDTEAYTTRVAAKAALTLHAGAPRQKANLDSLLYGVHHSCHTPTEAHQGAAETVKPGAQLTVAVLCFSLADQRQTGHCCQVIRQPARRVYDGFMQVYCRRALVIVLLSSEVQGHPLRLVQETVEGLIC